MQIGTTRFGTVVIQEDDLLHFPQGLIGLEECRYWIVCADASNSRLGWLQSADFADVAVAVLDPRTLVPSYRVRVKAHDATGLRIVDGNRTQVLVVIRRGDQQHPTSANLKAPLVVDLERRLGRQVICQDEFPVQYRLSMPPTATWRMSA